MKISEKQINLKIRWTLEFEYPVFNSDDEHLKFYLEESHCHENLLDYLLSDREEDRCKLCSIGEVEVLEINRDNQ